MLCFLALANYERQELLVKVVRDALNQVKGVDRRYWARVLNAG